jgi:hypothetical protein
MSSDDVSEVRSVLSTSVAGQLQETAEGSGGIEQYVGLLGAQ